LNEFSKTKNRALGKAPHLRNEAKLPLANGIVQGQYAIGFAAFFEIVWLQAPQPD
jgi:hypothetical protein